MPFQIIRADITKLKCDAVVNPANSALNGGGGVDGAIHRAAGEELEAACRILGHCEVGKAVITPGFALSAKYIIHTVGPRYIDGYHGEAALLRSCYEKSLQLATAHRCNSVAFPLIAAGSYGYPKEQALQIAVAAITEFLEQQELTVFLVVFDKSAFRIGKKLFTEIESFIDDHYVDTHVESIRRDIKRQEFFLQSDSCCLPREILSTTCGAMPPADGSLEDALKTIDESFTQMLLRKIDEKGITDAECYRKANIDRKLFSKIRNNLQYKPKKVTAIAFAIALELSLPETEELLKKAGYALSHSNKFDIIIEYFILRENYDIFTINEALFAFDQTLLGC